MTVRGNPSVASLVMEGETLLAEAGIPAARLEAEVLLARRLSVPRSALLIRDRDEVDGAAVRGFRGDVARRATRYPLQYITGVQEFYSLEFEVDERVLIPRPETEMIVDAVLRLAAPSPGPGHPLIVDVGTGSGCIAVAIAANLPSATILATDLSRGALEVAARNAARHAVTERVRFAEGDGLDHAFDAGLEGQADFVVSNPPYIDEADLEGLQAELRYEPRIALTPGPDGFSFTARLIARAAALLAPSGWLLLELGAQSSEKAMAFLDPGTWEAAGVREDMQGIPRLLIARRRGGMA